MSEIVVRDYRPDDASELLTLFQKSVRETCNSDYTRTQIEAWVGNIDSRKWSERFLDKFAIVAESPRGYAGFTELTANGHVDRFYVAADHQRIGVGRLLLATLLNEADRRGHRNVTVDASITAKPFFESRGFEVIVRQTVTLLTQAGDAVSLDNFRMQRAMTGR